MHDVTTRAFHHISIVSEGHRSGKKRSTIFHDLTSVIFQAPNKTTEVHIPCNLAIENTFIMDWHIKKENTHAGLEMKNVDLFLTSFLVYFLFITGISRYFDLLIHVFWLHFPNLDHNFILYSSECYETLR
jgi:hypothetical protein